MYSTLVNILQVLGFRPKGPTDIFEVAPEIPKRSGIFQYAGPGASLVKFALSCPGFAMHSST